VEDIRKRLLFKQPNFLKASFRRENLIYVVRKSENKDRDVCDLVLKLKGSGIIYARSRRKCVETAASMVKAGVSAEYYHAGLDHSSRNAVQQRWTVGKTRVIVATNAFGMGIDKADVQIVIHVDLPDSPESYFQEAGRAGRDGRRSFAILLYGPSDKTSIQQRINVNFPEIDTIKKTYSAIGNYLQVPLGGGKGMSFDFNMQEFAGNFKLSVYTAYSIIKILEICGYLELTDEINNPSRIKFLLNRDDLYKFQVSNAVFDSFIKLLLRSYTGVFTEFTAIDETLLAKKANVNQDVVKQYLIKLQGLNIIRYIPQKKTPIVYYAEERLDEKALYISRQNYQDRKERYIERAEAILQYAEKNDRCRSQLLLEYFGEKDSQPCGECDVCRSIKMAVKNKNNPDTFSSMISKALKQGPLTTEELAEKLSVSKDNLINMLRVMADNNLLTVSDSGVVSLK
jgi:ATP-dependent DNA helicase RecQ